MKFFYDQNYCEWYTNQNGYKHMYNIWRDIITQCTNKQMRSKIFLEMSEQLRDIFFAEMVDEFWVFLEKNNPQNNPQNNQQNNQQPK